MLLAALLMLAAVGCSPSPRTANDVSESESEAGTQGTAGDPETVTSTTEDQPTTSVAASSTTESPVGSTIDTAEDPQVATPPADLPLPTSAAEMITGLNDAETAVRDPSLTIPELDSWGRRQQMLYRHLVNNEEWADQIVAEVEADVRPAVEQNWQARLSLQALVDTETLHAELPAWRVVAPAPADELLGYYKAAEEETGIEWEFLAAINLIETRMGRIQGISTAGALGPMQFLPTTWAECCEGDPTVPADAIAGAARYLTIRGGPEDMSGAIWGYNNSDYYVDAVTAYAAVMMENERAYYGYHAWEIYFRSTEGLIRIPVGYEQAEPVAAADWLAEHPETLFGP